MSKKITDDQNQIAKAIQAIDATAKNIEKDLAELKKLEAEWQYEEEELAVLLTEAVAESFEEIARGQV